MAIATDLQTLITALAFKYVASGEWTHQDIPDQPFVESERRQVLFAAAVGVPTFYVSSKSPNRFLMRIVRRTAGLRRSRRYPGYLRVLLSEYQKTLLEMILEDGSDLIEALEMRPSFENLCGRLNEPELQTTSAKLTRQILDKAGAKSPLSLCGREFNQIAESFYREELRAKHLQEGLDELEQDIEEIGSIPALRAVMGNRNAVRFLQEAKRSLASGTASIESITIALALLLAVESKGAERSAGLKWDRAS
jgi:hypothetical protein